MQIQSKAEYKMKIFITKKLGIKCKWKIVLKRSYRESETI